MADDLRNSEDHRRRRNEDSSGWRRDKPKAAESRPVVKCARCGAEIFMHTTQCPDCGVHFAGEAWEFAHESERDDDDDSPESWGWSHAVLALLLAGLVLVLAAAVVFVVLQ